MTLHPSLAQERTPLAHNQFTLWRCVIAIAHADGKLSLPERDHFMRVLHHLDKRHALTAEQKAAFDDDLANAKDVSDLFRQINDPETRGQLFHFAGLLAHADGMRCAAEDAILRKLHAEHMSGLDLDRIRKDVRDYVAHETFLHELEKSQLRPQGGIAAVLDDFLLWLGIDVLED